MLALRKRPVKAEAIEAALAHLEDTLLTFAQKEVTSEQLGAWVMHELRQLDPVAYIRFASVYRNFTDAEAFQQLAREIRTDHPSASS
jgi:transcriptional repressor NrdR